MAKYALMVFAHHVKQNNPLSGDSIDLSYKKGEVGLTDRDMKTLGDVIKDKHFPNDFTINLRGNHITDKGAEILYAALLSARRTNLKINFSKTDISKEWRDKLQAALDHEYHATVLPALSSKGGFFSCLRKTDSMILLIAAEVKEADAGLDLK